MKYRAIIKKSDDWWIGWLIDLPGVNAQERSKKQLLQSLCIGAEDMLKTEIQYIPNAEMTYVDVNENAFLKAG